jgi:hypothetical protein
MISGNMQKSERISELKTGQLRLYFQYWWSVLISMIRAWKKMASHLFFIIFYRHIIMITDNVPLSILKVFLDIFHFVALIYD